MKTAVAERLPRSWRTPEELKAEMQKWKESLQAMSDGDLRHETNKSIWLSAYAHNNPKSDYHWQCDAVYEECRRRGKPEIYTEEHAKLMSQAGG